MIKSLNKCFKRICAMGLAGVMVSSLLTACGNKVEDGTNKTYDYLQISFTLYDANDNVVDTAFTNINNVKPGQTWKFEAMYFEESAVRWELDEITGW